MDLERQDLVGVLVDVLESGVLMQITVAVSVLNAHKHTKSHVTMHCKWASSMAHELDPDGLEVKAAKDRVTL